MLEQVAADLAGTETEHGRWVAGCIRTYIGSARLGATLDEVFGLAVAPGRTPWYRAQAQAERDRLLRELADDIPAENMTARVAELRRRLDRYATTSWLIDRRLGTPTAQNELLFRVFSADDKPPMSLSRLRDIIEV